MSIFSSGTTSNDQEIIAPVFEGYDVEDGGDLIALAESFDDQLQIVKAISALGNDITQYNVTAATMESASDFERETFEEEYTSVTEASVKNAWDSIKKFFSNLWGKLMSFFQSIKRFFDSMFRSTEGFLKTQESNLRNLNIPGFKFKMFKYTNVDAPQKAEKAENIKGIRDLYNASLAHTDFTKPETLETIKKTTAQSKEAREDILDNVRGMVIGKGAVRPDAFTKELHAYYRDGATSAEDRVEVALTPDVIIKGLKSHAAKASVAEFEKEVNAEFSNLMKRIAGAEKAIESNNRATTYGSGDDAQKLHRTSIPGNEGTNSHTKHYAPENRGAVLESVRTLASFVSAVKDIQLASFRSWKDAIVERDRAYRSAAMAAFRYKPGTSN